MRKLLILSAMLSSTLLLAQSSTSTATSTNTSSTSTGNVSADKQVDEILKGESAGSSSGLTPGRTAGLKNPGMGNNSGQSNYLTDSKGNPTYQGDPKNQNIPGASATTPPAGAKTGAGTTAPAAAK